MHPNAMDIMEKMLVKYARDYDQPEVCYDVGSYNVNGTFKGLIEKRGYLYRGLDIEAGPNVDIVIPEKNWDLTPAPLVISGNCLEHVARPWEWIQEVKKISSGILIIQVPFQRNEHKYPIDCWRLLPDGMRSLFDYAGFKTLEAGLYNHDCYGVAKV